MPFIASGVFRNQQLQSHCSSPSLARVRSGCSTSSAPDPKPRLDIYGAAMLDTGYDFKRTFRRTDPTGLT
jgi:hypothetical protein